MAFGAGGCAIIRKMKRLAFDRLGMFAGAAAVFALVLTGCFGGGGGDDDESTETTATPTVTVAPAVSVVTPVVPPVAPPTPTAAPPPVPTTAAPAPAPTTAAPTSSSLTYTIQSGDTLAAIADRFNVSVDDIVSANSIENPDVISVGQQLTIPTGSGGAAAPGGSGSSAAGATGSTSGNTYTVASGDTLAAIANRFNIDLDALIAANSIENQDVISVGQVLTIPSS